MRRLAVLVLLLVAAPALARAPIEIRRMAPRPEQSTPPPAEAPAVAPQTSRPSRSSPPPAAPPATPPAAAPDWAAGPGTPLSVWALRPEEAAPFDPRHPPRAHTVVAGDTLFALSVRYQIPLRPLIEANRLDSPFTIEVGQVLTLPPPHLHRVQRGETLLSVARRYNIDARSLALLNRLPKPYAVRSGDTLALPALARDGGPPQSEAPPPETRPPGSTRFAWPLTGRILTRFGPQPGGRRSDGVDIAAREGSDVKAAADGRVLYAGDDLAGYGHLMLVQHTGGWITAYAHCSALSAKEGDRVRKGQSIGAVGKARDGVAKLHFQVRLNDRPTDPLSALPPA